jgi:TatD DNase family protein
MKLGIGGVVTFKMEKSISFESNWFKNIVLETDSPYLAPVPFEGKEMKVAIC